MENTVLISEFDERIVFLPEGKTNIGPFYGGFQALPYTDVRANLIMLKPIRDLIDGALISLPENIRENFPDNLKRRLEEIGKSANNPKFLDQFEIKGELRIDFFKKYRWSPKDRDPISLHENEYRELGEVIRSGFVLRPDQQYGNEIRFIPESLVLRQSEPIQGILETWRQLDSRVIINGKKYLVVEKGSSQIDSFVPYFQIYSMRLDTYVLYKGGGDAVHHIEVCLPGLEILKKCPSEIAKDMQWEIMKGEIIDQHASFEEAVKELTGV